MSPPPSFEHSRIQAELTAFLVPIVNEFDLGVIGTAAIRDVGGTERNYRTPDLCFVSKARLSIIEDCWLNEAPDVAFEIRSPGDETYDKIPFYAERGVGLLVVIERDSKAVQLFRLIGKELRPVSPAADGTLLCEPLGACFRRLERPDGRGVLEVFLARDPRRRVEM